MPNSSVILVFMFPPYGIILINLLFLRIKKEAVAFFPRPPKEKAAGNAHGLDFADLCLELTQRSRQWAAPKEEPEKAKEII